MTKQTSVSIYTDGACSGNPGPGGWGAVLCAGNKIKQLNGGKLDTTNNQMELTAVIQSLNELKWPCSVNLYTDSEYVMKGFTEWMPNWKKNNWKTSSGPVANKELWLKLEEAAARHSIKWKWVKGHAGNADNELADRLAREGMEPYLGLRDIEF